MGRAEFEYSNKPGDSVYPIRPGVVVQLTDCETFFNKKAGKRLEHRVYIWMLRVFKTIPKGGRPRDRRIHAVIFKVPTNPLHRHQYKKSQSKSTMGWLMKLMAGERYRLVSEDCPWNYRASDANRFYQAIGLL